MPRARLPRAVLAAVLVAAAAVGCSTGGDRSASTGTGVTATAPPPTVPAGCRDNTAIPRERIRATLAPLPGPKTARSLLQKLTVADRSRGDDFCRNAFGPGWPDLDGNGCSARQDTLRRHGTQLRLQVIRSHGTGCPCAGEVRLRAHGHRGRAGRPRGHARDLLRLTGSTGWASRGCSPGPSSGTA